MKIEILNKKVFISFFSIFKNKKTINLEITEENFLLECIELTKYYLNIPETIVKSDVTNEYIVIFIENSYIKIPLLSTVENEYEDVEDICTRFIVDNKTVVIFSNLKNLVKYRIEDGKLFIRKIGKEIIEEIEIKHLNFIESGELSFICNNEWSSCILPIYIYVEKILFCLAQIF
ncbi:hypothetical protein NAPIS_ORF01945 [Vairimorpha apis BRL 01]|uniref:Uncharacterized protein n=1 Tax=Vairimorpha apis BRL 01 TaxID=1037528 RepID=T0KZ05_9MICR|nr:hypothetical protein NAPIS_ORF01945 [Vairimorpha apis BRL 01]